MMPDEAYDKKIVQMFLYRAISQLPDKQAKRIYAHFFLGLSFSAIAKAENVSEVAILNSINRGVQKLRNYLTSIF